jgi:5-methylcytosine-specific restriction endonuclease McrA
MRQRTDEQRLAYNTYMREFRKKPSQIEKNRRRDAEKYLRWRATASSEQLEGERQKNLRRMRRIRWGSSEEYAARLAKQQGLCALCGTPFDASDLGRPVQDHDHATEELREFLHCRCNLGISHFLDDPALCILAAEYLKKHGK